MRNENCAVATGPNTSNGGRTMTDGERERKREERDGARENTEQNKTVLAKWHCRRVHSFANKLRALWIALTFFDLFRLVQRAMRLDERAPARCNKNGRAQQCAKLKRNVGCECRAGDIFRWSIFTNSAAIQYQLAGN